MTDLFLLAAVVVAVPGITLLSSGELEPAVTTPAPAAAVAVTAEAPTPMGKLIRLAD